MTKTDNTPDRSRRVICFALRQGSEADGIIADWIDALKEIGMEHSAAIRDILRACVAGQPFLTPLRHRYYSHRPMPTPEPLSQASAEAQKGLTEADISLLKQLRIQMGENK